LVLAGKLQVLVEEQNSYKKRMLEVADKVKEDMLCSALLCSLIAVLS